MTFDLAADWAGLRAGRVILEDDAVLVLNKPAGLAVTGERRETDLVRIAADAGERLYPVHRIDKVTSGAVLLARDLRWHGDLTRQFSRQTVAKAYLALVRPGGLPAVGAIDLPLSVGRKNRVRVAAPRAAIVAGEDAGTAVPPPVAPGRWSVPASEVFGHVRVYPSVTAFGRLWQDQEKALLVVWPFTGRRHQIRVHLAWIGHPVLGDPLFPAPGNALPGGPAGRGLPRTHLHSWRLVFDAAWRSGARVRVEAPPDEDFWIPLGPEWGRADRAERAAGLLAAARARSEEHEAANPVVPPVT